MANPLTLPMVRRSVRNLLARPATRRYPVEIRDPFAGARGRIQFDVSTCNYCMLCARRCPAAAITVSRENRTWAIEHLTCIACGVCVDVCARKSLSMSPEARKPGTPLAEASGDGANGNDNGRTARRPGHEEWHSPAPETPAPVPAVSPAQPR